uniref:Uncharacterized protein n=1 Tax=Anguilla anguilla TaxID=7936 RepID=A0A0E9XYY4_ANGAN
MRTHGKIPAAFLSIGLSVRLTLFCSKQSVMMDDVITINLYLESM